jgi:hypothetical protein
MQKMPMSFVNPESISIAGAVPIADKVQERAGEIKVIAALASGRRWSWRDNFNFNQRFEQIQ